MKNNIRYKGNINSTSVIIFLKSQKTLNNVTLLGRTSSGVFGMLLFFIFDLHFVICSSFVNVLHFCCCFFTHVFFSTSSLTLLWTIARVFTPCFILSAQPIVEWFASFSFFDHSVVFLLQAAALSGHFLPTGVFYLMLLHQRFITCVYQGFPGSQQFFLEVCRASYWSPAHLFIWFILIHKLYIQNDSVLNSAIY